MWTLVGARMRAFRSRSLGVFTFPWGRVTDTRERRSRHLSFYDLLNPCVNQNRELLVCAPEFYLVGACMREAYATRLESIHLPVGTRDGSTLRQRGLKEPGVGSDRTEGLQENRLIPTVTVGPIELPGDI
ncbi:hypothetical protein CRG98_012186 [Punica granatum]|uniref:Uncharacterized protein n=1 Tax=Punica granatum TaxID=22663 RepID=A0A2I0KFZ6_PUNGR|nr:hypothetical protein CRG98_012186 [Punica granatum]